MHKTKGRIHLLPFFLVCLLVSFMVLGSRSISHRESYVLEVKNRQGILLASWPVKDTFAITFRHSVNKGQVKEQYSILPQGEFYLKTAWFQSYGAGMMDSLAEGVTMKEEKDFLRLDFPVKPMTQVSYAAAGIAQHRLEIGNNKIDLFHRWPYQPLIFSITTN